MLPILRKVSIEPVNNRVFNNLDRIFEEFLPSSCVGFTGVGNLDMYEDKDTLYVEAELPGFDREEIQLSLEDGMLRLEAEHKDENEQKDTNYYIRERGHKKWSRNIQLPVSVANDKVKATFTNGVLSVALEKPEKDKPQKIDVK